MTNDDAACKVIMICDPPKNLIHLASMYRPGTDRLRFSEYHLGSSQQRGMDTEYIKPNNINCPLNPRHSFSLKINKLKPYSLNLYRI